MPASDFYLCPSCTDYRSSGKPGDECATCGAPFPVTAETITNEQIRELRTRLQREHRGRAGKQRIHEMLVHIGDALRGEEHQRYRGACANARAYVAGMIAARPDAAEILNARAKESAS